MTFRVDKRLLYGVFGVLALALAFGIGLFFSGAFNDDQAAAPAPAAQEPVAQAPAQPPGQAQPPAQAESQLDVQPAQPQDPMNIPDASVAEVIAGAELSDAQTAAVPRISLDDASALVGSEDVVFVDTRTAQEFETSRVPGALSYPAYETEARLTELPQDKEIIVYCA